MDLKDIKVWDKVKELVNMQLLYMYNFKARTLSLFGMKGYLNNHIQNYMHVYYTLPLSSHAFKDLRWPLPPEKMKIQDMDISSNFNTL